MEMRGDGSGYRIGFNNCEEVVEPVRLTVDGELPAWLEGTLLRNGPGVYEIETDEGTIYSLDHWFDGLAVLHRFTIDDGAVHYRNAHLARGLERRIADQGYADHLSFGNDPCQGLFGKLFTLFRRDVTDPETGRSVQNTGVTVGKLPDDRLISKTDASLLHFVDWDTLDAGEPRHYSDLDEHFEGQLAAAHSQKDLDRNRLINYALKLGRTGRYTVFSVAEDPAEHEVLASFDAPPAYIHSFALETGDFETWSEAGCYPGEPIMLAAPEGENEDEGVLLSVVLDGRNGSSFLVVLDAADLSELARATGAPAVPFGFHGNFYGVGSQEQ